MFGCFGGLFLLGSCGCRRRCGCRQFNRCCCRRHYHCDRNFYDNDFRCNEFDRINEHEKCCCNKEYR